MNGVILSALRSPIGRLNGSLSALAAPQMGAQVARAALEAAEVDRGTVDETLFGCVLQAGVGQAPARQVALGAGLPPSVPATTINKVCASGLKTVALADQAIRAGDGHLFLCGGMESMSNAPYLVAGARTGLRAGHSQMTDAAIHDGLWCSFGLEHMGVAAERIAETCDIDRESQDRYALESHRRAVRSAADGEFLAEIAPLTVSERSGTREVAADECPRPETSLQALARLRPAFRGDGTVTAGNAPPLSDGAAALVVASAERARVLGRRPLARIIGYAQAAREPGMIFAAPPLAIRALLERTRTGLADYDLWEVNEAFAAQILANQRATGWDPLRVNVRGGAIALGHPLGATGARILVTLIHALRARGGGRGIAALCLGGGGAAAMAIEVDRP